MTKPKLDTLSLAASIEYQNKQLPFLHYFYGKLNRSYSYYPDLQPEVTIEPKLYIFSIEFHSHSIRDYKFDTFTITIKDISSRKTLHNFNIYRYELFDIITVLPDTEAIKVLYKNNK